MPSPSWSVPWEPAQGPSFGPAGQRRLDELRSQAAQRGAPSFALQFGGELRTYAGIPASGPIPSTTARELVHGYYAAVSFMDAQVGRVLDALQRHGFADDTIVILWGDHGWHLGDHGMWCKHTNYEEATRSALVLAAPGREAAGRTTVADLAAQLAGGWRGNTPSAR